MLESAKPPAHGFAHAGRIDTGTAGECQALGHGFDGDPDDDLVGGLGDLSGPAGADVNRFCPDSVKDRLGTRHGGILAAGHDRQRRAFGAARATGDGCVDERRAARRQFARKFACGEHVGRAHVDDDLARKRVRPFQ